MKIRIHDRGLVPEELELPAEVADAVFDRQRLAAALELVARPGPDDGPQDAS